MEHIQIVVDLDTMNDFNFVMKLWLFATVIAIILVARGILYGRCRRIKKLSHQRIFNDQN